MSIDATRWAYKQKITLPSLKFILVSMADRANEKHQCFPSVKRLALDTALDRKTILKALAVLEDNGVIQDTGKRTGRTKQVKVWELVGVSGRDDDSVEIIHSISKQSQKRNSSKNGTVKQSQKRDALVGNSPKNGTCNSPKNGTCKQSQKRDTEPTSINLPIEPTNPVSDSSIEDKNLYRSGGGFLDKGISGVSEIKAPYSGKVPHWFSGAISANDLGRATAKLLAFDKPIQKLLLDTLKARLDGGQVRNPMAMFMTLAKSPHLLNKNNAGSVHPSFKPFEADRLTSDHIHQENMAGWEQMAKAAGKTLAEFMADLNITTI